MKLFESEKVFAFLDIQPLSRGHTVRITYLLRVLFPRSPHPACCSWRGDGEVVQTAAVASASNLGHDNKKEKKRKSN